jgi:hypothetical protein
MPGARGGTARSVVLVLGVLAAIALLLALATGAFDQALWNLPPATPHDPITIP